MSANDELTQWQYLASEAKAGRLTLDASVASDCLAACEDLIKGFETIQTLAAYTQRPMGFGGFDSGHELAAMFGKKGIGGVDAIDGILRQHREVVGLIRDTISASVANVGSQDDTNAQGFSGIQPG